MAETAVCSVWGSVPALPLVGFGERIADHRGQAATSIAACSAPPACVGEDVLWYCGCFLKLLLPKPFFVFVNVIGFLLRLGYPQGRMDVETLISSLSAVILEVWGKVLPPTPSLLFSFLGICAKFKSRTALRYFFLTLQNSSAQG